MVARTADGETALAWAKPDLVEVNSAKQGAHGRHLRPAMGLGMAHSGQLKPLVRWRRGQLPAAVRLLLDGADLDSNALD